MTPLLLNVIVGVYVIGLMLIGEQTFRTPYPPDFDWRSRLLVFALAFAWPVVCVIVAVMCAVSWVRLKRRGLL